MAASISRRLIIGLIALCIVLFANTLVCYYNISRLVSVERWIAHTLQVRETLQQLLVAVVDTETSARGFAIAGDAEYTERFERASSRIDTLQHTLRQLTSDNPLQQQRLALLGSRIRDKLAWMQGTIDARRTGETSQALYNISTGHDELLMARIQALHSEIQREEDRLLQIRNDMANAHLRVTLATLAAFAAGGILLSVLIFYFLRRGVLMRRRAEETILESEQQYRRIFSEHPHPMYIYDLETLRFLDVNKIAVTHYGYTREEFLSMTLKDIRPQEDLPRLMEGISKFSGTLDKAGIWRHCKKDGSIIEVDVTLQELTVNGRRTKMALLNDVTERRRAEEALHNANQMLRLILDHVPQRIFWKDLDLRYLGCNRLFAEDSGWYGPEDLIGKDDYVMSWRTRAESFRGEDKLVLRSGLPKLNYQTSQIRADGAERWLRISKVPLHDIEGKVIGILGTYEDITEHKQAEQRLRLQASAIESSVNGIFIADAVAVNHPIEYVNPAFQTITGYSAEEVMGFGCLFLQGDDRQQEGSAALRVALAEQRACHVVLRNYRKDGSLFWNDLQIAPVRDDKGSVTHYIGILNDITERTRYLEELEHQANFDALTGLANRNLLKDRLTQAIVHADRNRLTVGVVLIDLDNFKFLNDSIGHAFGDALLNVIAGRLTALIHDEDTVARYGADEFVLVLGEYDGERSISSIVTRVLSSVAELISLQGHEVHVTCSVGISLYPQDGADSETLLRHADVAMYRAKEAGRNTFQVFRADMTQRIHERISLEQAMRNAIESDEFQLQYQPQVDLGTGRIFGAEALIRWKHPEQGMISPARFIPIAEDSDLILPIGDWVLRTACKQGKAWRDAGLRHIVISVNVSVRQFRQEGFADRVIDAVRASGLDPGCLELELTESLLMTHVDELLEVLNRLKAVGIRLAVDDFGTGYSSLNYLKRLPVDKLKIDQSFVRDIPHDQDNMAIAKAIIALARSMSLTVIAEGVETKEQLDFLRASDCDEMQGYYFSKAVDADAFAQMLAEDKTL
jgi:diguanylate cyclase (GGDEF)-like protein/PAS domain S-box-containing protein